VQTVDDVTVSLALDEQGRPVLTTTRRGRELSAIPAKVRKDRGVKSLLERRDELKRQASRMRESLEAAMCRGDGFSGAELQQLLHHPLLRPLLSRLLLVGEGAIGYPVADGQALRHHSGRKQKVKKDDQLRLAHPCDLLGTGEWQQWQHECFGA